MDILRQKCSLPALCVALAILSGCASTRNAPPVQQVEIKEIERTPVTVFTDEATLLRAAADAFRAENTTLFLTVQAAGADAAKELREKLLSGDVPDAVYLTPPSDQGIYSALVQDEALYDLSPMFAEEGKPELYSGFLDSPAAKPYGDARITGAPMAYDCAGLLYKAAEGREAPPPDYEGFIALGEAAVGDKAEAEAVPATEAAAAEAEDTVSLFGYPQDYPAYLDPFILPLLGLSADKPRYRTADYADGGFTQEKTLAAAEKLAELSPYFFKGIPQSDKETVYTAFEEDRILFVPGDKGTYELLRDEYGAGDSLTLAAPPSMDSKSYVLTAVTPAYIPSAAAHPEEGMRFLRMLYDSRYYTADIPPVKGSSSALNGYEKMAADLFENGAIAYCGTFMEEMREDTAAAEDAYAAIGELLSGNLPPEEWATAMQDAVGEYMAPPEAEGASSSSSSSTSAK